MADTFVVVHFATTFDESAAYVPRDACEVIAISWCTVDAKSLSTSALQSVLVKPVNTPVTPDCTKLFSLSWRDVKDGLSFKDAVAEFDRKLMEQVTGKQFSFLTVDVHSLRVSLPREARDKSVVLPAYLQHPRVFDLRNEYSKWQAIHPEALSYPSSSLGNIITALGVEVASTWSDDVQDNVKTATDVYAKILVQLLKKSEPLESHMSVLTKPFDAALDAKAFLAERSKILYLSNLPSDTTQSELESWFTQSGGRPVAFWALKSADSDTRTSQQGLISKEKSISGFAIFSKHEEAAEALCMNGRALLDKVVEVQASSTRVLDRASSLLTSFPTSKNRPRPGDWTCPSCGFSNFQRRIACFRCSFPATSAIAIQEQIYTGPNSVTRDTSAASSMPTGMRNNKSEDRQTYAGHGGYQEYQASKGVMKNSNSHGNGYGHNYNHQGGSNQRPHYNSQVPFRAGDWKCPNESCQYHNFAKNLSCLKCGAPKPASVMHQNVSNGTNGGSHLAAGSNGTGSVHSVNTTAAAIAAATASGQPLTFNNNIFGLQQPMPHHSRQSNSSHSSSSSSPIHSNGLYSNISHLQQLQYQQNKAQGCSNYSQNSSILFHQGQLAIQGTHGKQSSSQSLKNSSGLNVQQSYSYKQQREPGNNSEMNSLSSQINSMSLNNQ